MVRATRRQAAYLLFPQAVDHRRHQAQHAAGALEFHQRGPVGVKTVKNLGMDWVRGLEPKLVIRIAAFGRKLLAFLAIKIKEFPGHRIAGDELRLLNKRLEEAPAHNFKTFLGAGRPPRGLHAADDVAQPVERRASALAAHFDVIGYGVWRAGGVRGREADHQQALLGELGGFRECLSKG
jgi:hypothetical protein